MGDSAGLYIISDIIIDNKRKTDYVGMRRRKFKECLTEHTVDIKLN